MRPHRYFQCAAFDLLCLARIDEVTPGQDQGPRGKYLGFPEMGKAQVNDW